jgi:hypothetical protein
MPSWSPMSFVVRTSGDHLRSTARAVGQRACSWAAGPVGSYRVQQGKDGVAWRHCSSSRTGDLLAVEGMRQTRMMQLQLLCR